MRAKRNITPEEVRNAKLLLSKGLSDAEVAAIIGRSVSAVVNIRNGAYKFSLDASKSNAIYGRSATVQPAAYYVHIWRRVA